MSRAAALSRPALTTPHRSPRRVTLWGNPVAKELVNLDAIIERADFEEDVASQIGQQQELSELRLMDLDPERGGLWRTLRKPDFQRETSSWTPENVAGFIHSFVNGEFLPALIMWRNPVTGNRFIIDGAHRLSALMAWVVNDYGNGTASHLFYEGRIAADQKRAHDKTKKLVEEKVGSYADFRHALRSKEESESNWAIFADSIPIQVQRVGGEAKKAELAFYNINLKATPIDPTEALLIQSRKKPSAMAARAIVRQSTGLQYWKDFPEPVRKKISAEAQLLFTLLYIPIPDPAVDTIDLAIAGPNHGKGDALSLVYNLGVLSNSATELLKRLTKAVSAAKSSKATETEIEKDDLDGNGTRKYLINIRRVIARFTGRQPRSLGLHPIVYSYALTGRFQPSAFLATIGLIMDLDKSKQRLIAFTQSRAKFEEFLLRHRYFVNQIVAKYGGQLKSYDKLLGYYREVLRLIQEGKTFQETKDALLAQKSIYSFLRDVPNELVTMSANISEAVGDVSYFRKAQQTAIRCEECHAYINARSISRNHRLAVRDDGKGNADNIGLVHFFCNNTYIEEGHPPIPPLPDDLATL